MVLIDIGIPNKCYKCPCYGYDNNCMVIAKSLDDEFPWNDRPNWCPLKEIVRCEECKYWEENGATSTQWLPCMDNIHYPKDFFCARGERKIE